MSWRPPENSGGQIPLCSVGKEFFFRSNFHGLSFVLCIKRAYLNIAKSENLVGCVVLEGSRSRAWPNGVKCDTKLSRTLNFTATLLWSFRFLSKRWISASRMSRNFSYWSIFCQGFFQKFFCNSPFWILILDRLLKERLKHPFCHLLWSNIERSNAWVAL